MATGRLLIATTNPAKLAEYRLILRGLGIELELVSLAELGISETPEETGATFIENALIKARFYFQRARIATLADDGGLEIDALGGEPGVRSHRWLGSGGDDSDQALVDEVIRRMKGVEAGRRTARIRAAIALIHEEGGAIPSIRRMAQSRVRSPSGRTPEFARGFRIGRYWSFPGVTVIWANSAMRKRHKSASGGLRCRGCAPSWSG